VRGQFEGGNKHNEVSLLTEGDESKININPNLDSEVVMKKFS
jgi:hypothetical protein